MVDISQNGISFKGSNGEYSVNKQILFKSIKNVLLEPVFDFFSAEKDSDEIDINDIPKETDKIMMRSAMTQRYYNEAEPSVGKKFNIVL